MLGKVAVDGNTVLRFAQMHPIRFRENWLLALLQEKNIAGDFGAGIGAESVVRQTDSTQQFSALRDVFTHIGSLLVHRSL